MLRERLKAARKAKKLTQEKLAELINTTKGTISNYENGHSTPSNDMLTSLSSALNVSVDYLLGITNKPTHKMGDFIIKAGTFIEYEMQRWKLSEDMTWEEVAYYYKGFPESPENYDVKYGVREDIDTGEMIKTVHVVKKYETKAEKDIAKRLKQFEADLENSDGLAFNGEPLSDEAKESLKESMELLFRQTQRINKKYTPKKYRDEE